LIAGGNVVVTGFAKGPGKYMLAGEGADIFAQFFEAKEDTKESSEKPSLP
jgi:hypothetical protein